MTEAELIKKIQGLREIKPKKEWVFLTKSQILGEAPSSISNIGHRMSNMSNILFFPKYKVVLAPVLAIFALIGVLALSQNSLPGDILYSVKKLTEKGQAVFVSDTNKSKYQLEQANKRLEDLNKIAEQNQVKKLAPAIDEFQKSLAQATKNLKETSKIDKEIIDQAKKIVENKEKVEKLGVVIGESEELENALKEIVEYQIKYLENRTLTEEQSKLLSEAKTNFEAGDFSKAFEKISQIQPNNQ